jgi:NAD-dependent SIR2 family protein deacetylase
MAKIRIKCDNCGGTLKNRAILYEHKKNWENDVEDIHGEAAYQSCQCARCDFIRYRTATSWSEDQDPACEKGAVVK